MQVLVNQAEIHRMVKSEDAYERQEAAYQFFFYYKELPDKEQAWRDLSQLTDDNINTVRWSATEALGVAFPYITDKLQAWDNLHRLTQDVEYIVRIFAAEAVSVAFAYIPDKKQAWDDLYRLTLDENRGVSTTAFISLGKVSVFKATDAENKENLKKYMEDAINYFGKSLIQIFFTNPAKFCLPFYRSFYTLIFEPESIDTEIQQYLVEARYAVEGSKSKEKLLEAVENLGNALKEAQNLRDKDFNAVRSDLNAYRRYIERATELLESTQEKAPGATKLLKKGLPIIDGKIKEILAEIQEKTKALCRQTKGTPFYEFGREVNSIGLVLPQTRDPIGLDKNISSLQFLLSAICEKFPENDKGEACELIKKLKNEPEIEDKLPLINMVLSKISTQIENIDMTKIEIKNSQIAIGNGNIQKMEPPIQTQKESHKNRKKTSFFDFINLSAIAATPSGFGTYIISETLDIIPVTDYKHLINVVLAITIFIIVLLIARKYHKK